MGVRAWLETAKPPVLGKEIQVEKCLPQWMHSPPLSGTATERRW
jgi:hypothetical protein